MGAEEEELLPLTMNGGRKTLNQGMLWSKTEAPPTLCLWVPPQHKESSEQGDMRSNLIKETKDSESEHHPNGVRSQLRRDDIVESKQISDKLQNRKLETAPQSILIDR